MSVCYSGVSTTYLQYKLSLLHCLCNHPGVCDLICSSNVWSFYRPLPPIPPPPSSIMKSRAWKKGNYWVVRTSGVNNESICTLKPCLGLSQFKIGFQQSQIFASMAFLAIFSAHKSWWLEYLAHTWGQLSKLTMCPPEQAKFCDKV